MVDFHNGIYFPTLAFTQGVSPYGLQYAQEYKVPRPAPAYSPFVFLAHIPFALLPLPAADICCFIFVLLTYAAIVYIVLSEFNGSNILSWFPVVLLLLLISRPGHTTLVSGYFTGELALGILIALRYARSLPWLAACGVLLASGKPTAVIPLGLILLFRGNWKSLIIGTLLSGFFAAIAVFWLVSNIGFEALVASIREGQAAHMADPIELPVNTWTRIDIVAIANKWLGGDPSEMVQLLMLLPLMIFPGITLWKRQKQGDDSGSITLSGGIAVLAILTTFYHQVYDSIICFAPIAALFFSVDRDFCKLSKFKKCSLIFLISAPLWNYLSSEYFLSRIGEYNAIEIILTSINSVLLCAGLIIFSFIALFNETSKEKFDAA